MSQTSALEPETTRRRSPIARIVGASLVGTTVEWYDFFLYGVAAAAVFPHVFFPNAKDPLQATLLSFATYWIGFVFRPLGGLVFGHFGDRLGRKKLLVLSLLMMGVATFGIGLLPSYAQVGALAPVLLTVLRCVQGFALGGEWGGAVLIVSEHGEPGRRGFWASWPQAGAPAGQLIANGVLAMLEIFTAMGARMAENVAYYIFTIVITTYVVEQLKLPKSFALNAVLIAAAIHFCTIPMWGALSDRIGRKPVYLIGAVGVGVWAFVFFAMLNTKSFALAVIAVIVGLLFHGAMYGPQSAFFAELFGTKIRYSGVSIGYQLASIIAGGLAPIIAVDLLANYHTGKAIAIYVAICSVISVVAVLSYRETRQRDLATITKGEVA